MPKDNLFKEAAKLVVETQYGSMSLLQRRLRLSYTKAAQVMEELEVSEIVGEFNGTKNREVKFKDLDSLNIHLDSIT